MKLNIPPYVRIVMDTLYENGFSSYVVGGAVRDALLGDEPEDWDVATNATVEDTKRCFKKHFDAGARHGTVGVLSEGKVVEVTTYRVDGEYEDNRHPKKVEFTDRIEDDLKRRDFTINALAYNDECGLLDLFGGIDDLKDGLLRAVGNPDERFSEDALRILRALRFSARLGFGIEKDTLESIKKNAHLLLNISAERICDELKKMLLSADDVSVLYDSGVFGVIMPGGSNNAQIIKKTKRVLPLRLAALLLGAKREACVRSLQSLKLDNKTKNDTLKILDILCEGIEGGDVDVRKALHKYGHDLLLQAFDLMSASGVDTAELLNIYARVKDDPCTIKSLVVSGDDLLKLGIEGRRIGATIKALMDAVLQSPSNNKREVLLNMAKELQKSCNKN